MSNVRKRSYRLDYMVEMKGVRSYLGELAGRENDADGFDPFRNLFVAQLARPAQLVEINLRTLSPFQRALLVIDGTVTKFIEAYMMEPVEIRRLSQVQRSLLNDHDWLEARQGTNVVAREVMLIGRRSRRMSTGSWIMRGKIGMSYALSHTPNTSATPAGALVRAGLRSRQESRSWIGKRLLPAGYGSA